MTKYFFYEIANELIRQSCRPLNLFPRIFSLRSILYCVCKYESINLLLLVTLVIVISVVGRLIVKNLILLFCKSFSR